MLVFDLSSPLLLFLVSLTLCCNHLHRFPLLEDELEDRGHCFYVVYPNTYHSRSQKRGLWPFGNPQDPFRSLQSPSSL